MTTQEMQGKVARLVELREMVAELNDELSAIEGEIKDEMSAQEADKLFVGPYKVMWTPYTSTRLDSKAIKSELPDLWKRYSVEVSTKRFSIGLR